MFNNQCSMKGKRSDELAGYAFLIEY